MSRTDVSPPASGMSSRLSPRSDGLLAVAGAGTFAVLVVLLHFLENGFQPSSRFISEYVLGDWGLLMNIAFFAQGCALLAVAHGLRHSVEPGRRVRASVVLFYVGGVTQLFTAVFNSDSIADSDAGRASWHGTLHDLSGFLGFICLTLATFFLRGVFARDAQWRRFAPLALLYGFALTGLFALVLFAPSDTFGIVQRVFVTVAVLWIATLGCGLIGAKPVMRQ